ncbi:hypothetical protein OHC33_001399 [Knufia fluminis]|uniref:Cyclase n=1 Tax=Knufia fluminis TaxID=191047 RepID=A0AAN8EVP8_9EURO|nr:hypothetical protein OHC33_001399 [Knufia fluminis]
MSQQGPPVPFSSLPLSKTHEAAKLNAWGAYGDKDERGFLNRQTDAIVAAAAASEIKTGTRVSLNAALDFQGDRPLFGRQVFEKNVYQKPPRIVHDDTWHFNTQSSSQWDGLRHFGYQQAQRFYNDTTLEDIAGTTERAKSQPNILGVQNLEKHGIVGRGVLIDFARWREGPGKDVPGVSDFKTFERTPIKLEWLKEILKWQGTELKFGDILIIRSGYMPSYYALTDLEVTTLQNMHPPSLGGVEQSEELLKWIWENFSCVAADHPSFEMWPTPLEWSCHEVFLAGWGCPIGELFELEELSRVCEREGRWSFFVTSEAVNVPGGVASPPNALAIF